MKLQLIPVRGISKSNFLQSGDILFKKFQADELPSWVIRAVQLFTTGPSGLVHVAIAVSDSEIIESQSSGLEKRSLRTENQSYKYEVVRMTGSPVIATIAANFSALLYDAQQNVGYAYKKAALSAISSQPYSKEIIPIMESKLDKIFKSVNQKEDFFCSELVAFSYHFAAEQAKALRRSGQISKSENIPEADKVFAITDASLNPNTMFSHLEKNSLLFTKVGSIPEGSERKFV